MFIRTFLLVAVIAPIVSSASALHAELTEHDAVRLVRQLPEFRDFQRFARKHHSAIDITDNELVTDASRLEPPGLHVPAWRISVTHSVTDDPATGDGHYSKWNEFLVDARSGAILVLWRVGNPYRYITLKEWHEKTRELMKET
jgi:hypothetical protein